MNVYNYSMSWQWQNEILPLAALEHAFQGHNYIYVNIFRYYKSETYIINFFLVFLCNLY